MEASQIEEKRKLREAADKEQKEEKKEDASQQVSK
jgi:hypothetical protein